MARHIVGEYSIEVLHRRNKQTGRINVAVYVFRGKRYIERGEFWFNAFNSMELRRKLPSLSAFYVKQLAAVIDDARGLPKGGDVKGRLGMAKARKKPKAKRGSRRRGL